MKIENIHTGDITDIAFYTWIGKSNKTSFKILDRGSTVFLRDIKNLPKVKYLWEIDRDHAVRMLKTDADKFDFEEVSELPIEISIYRILTELSWKKERKSDLYALLSILKIELLPQDLKELVIFFERTGYAKLTLHKDGGEIFLTNKGKRYLSDIRSIELNEDVLVETNFFQQPKNISSMNSVFVTYSWDSEQHKTKVLSFTNFLREKGFDAELDRKKSQESSSTDFNKMMHQGITDYNKVIIILTDGYKKKANGFEGGVGTEYQMIINDIEKNPRKYILVCFGKINDNIFPTAFRSREVINVDDPSNHNTLFAKLQDKEIIQFSTVSKVKPKIILQDIPKFEEFIKSADDLIEDEQVIDVISVKKEDLTKSLKSNSFKDYLNENFKVANDRNGDIINLSKDEISIDFGINNKDGEIAYVIKKINDQIEINPYNSYLNSLKIGGPIYPISYWYIPFNFQFPTIDFKVVNNSDKTLFFTKAIFRISKSKSDLFPILLIRGTGYYMNFPLINIGWGPVKDCSMKFNLVTPDTKTNYKNGYEHELLIGDFDFRSNKTDLTKFFKLMGVNVDVIQKQSNHFERGFYRNEVEAQILEARGRFQTGVAKIFGEIYYCGINSAGNITSEKVMFEGKIFLGGPFPGAPAPPSFVYDVSFDSDNIDYTRSIELSQAIKTGEFDRFNIKISAPKSSRHNFDVDLVYNNNKRFTVPNIMLNYFMTEPDSSYIRDAKFKREIDF